MDLSFAEINGGPTAGLGANDGMPPGAECCSTGMLDAVPVGLTEADGAVIRKAEEKAEREGKVPNPKDCIKKSRVLRTSRVAFSGVNTLLTKSKPPPHQVQYPIFTTNIRLVQYSLVQH